MVVEKICGWVLKEDDKIIIDKELLEEVLHELTCITGLSAFDLVRGDSQYPHELIVDYDNCIKLDYTDLIKKIENIIPKKRGE